jgi:hypothetical protein
LFEAIGQELTARSRPNHDDHIFAASAGSSGDATVPRATLDVEETTATASPCWGVGWSSGIK